jgi:hypothetical protein
MQIRHGKADLSRCTSGGIMAYASKGMSSFSEACDIKNRLVPTNDGGMSNSSLPTKDRRNNLYACTCSSPLLGFLTSEQHNAFDSWAEQRINTIVHRP